MKVKGIIHEDFVNYKKPSMVIEFPYCTFKCGMEICQNSSLSEENNIEISIDKIIDMYIKNPITQAIVMQGLEPFDSWNDLSGIVIKLRQFCDDDIVIYTGYNKEEIIDYINKLKKFKNIIVKFGRYIPNQAKHYDNTLGVYLISSNQYSEVISDGD